MKKWSEKLFSGCHDYNWVMETFT